MIAAKVRLSPTAFWQDDAACIGMPLEMFFGSDDAPLTSLQAQAGRDLCVGCPVRRDCLLDALIAGERSGLRGGYLGHERRNALLRFDGSLSAAMAAYDVGVFHSTKRRRK